MARPDDAENQMSNEQAPLLADPQSDQEPGPKKAETKQASGYFWKIFWAIVAILIAALFIKGWIDAGSDVDVRCMTRGRPWNHSRCFSPLAS